MSYTHTAIELYSIDRCDYEIIDTSIRKHVFKKQTYLPKTTKTTKELAIELEAKDRLQKAKTNAMKARRREFASNRGQLVLLLIQAGVEYVCADEDCEENEYLTVDHKYPLSRGGSDDLNNLQFMCQHHNSIKGDSF